jgi:protein-S-isoprenylcysteine O-methyltransferase Ste14
MFTPKLLIFKTVTVLLFVVFAWFISDVRNKNAKPIIKQPWLSVMRICYPISPLCFIYFLITTRDIFILDYFALIIMVLGTAIVIAAKTKLGKNHSWTGYSTTNVSEFTKTGIYRFIRHPLYLGIIIAVTGTALVVFQRYFRNILVFLIYLIGMIFTFVFIFVSSKKETEFLKEKFGEDFINYVNQVPSFFPVIKRSKND